MVTTFFLKVVYIFHTISTNLKKEMKANYSETFIDIIVSVNRRKVTIDFRFFLQHTANISCFSIP